MLDTGWRPVVEDMDVNVSNASWQRLAAIVGCLDKQGIENSTMEKGRYSAGAAAKIEGRKLQAEGRAGVREWETEQKSLEKAVDLSVELGCPQ